MRLLVTGGAGFIGSNFVQKESGVDSKWDSITVLDALTYAGRISNLGGLIDDQKINFVHGNVLDTKLLSDVLDAVDVVVNFAAESHVDNSILRPNLFVETNVLGTQNLLEISRQKGVKTFLQISTDEVYGTLAQGSWTEQSSLAPNSPYSASKASADLISLSYYKTYGMDVRITRCSNNYGPKQYPEKIIPYFISLLKERKKIPIYGDGSNIRDWLHVDDHCNAISKVITLGQPGEIYNVGGGQEMSNLELALLILDHMNLESSYINFVEDRKGHDFRYSVNYTKAKNELDYEPRVPFLEGIKKTIDWYL